MRTLRDSNAFGVGAGDRLAQKAAVFLSISSLNNLRIIFFRLNYLRNFFKIESAGGIKLFL